MSRHLESHEFVGFDRLDSQPRATALGHLEGCAECRARWLEDDPTRIFALLSLAPIPDEALARLSARVGDAVDAESGERRRGARLRALVSVAASVLLAAAFLGYLATRTAVDLGWPAAPGMTAVAEREAGTEALPAQGVEVISSPGAAQVLELSVGETQVVMIFDEAMEI